MSGLLPYKHPPYNEAALNKLDSLVENRKVFTLEKCELNIYETYQAAERVPLKFDDLVITSMLRGKKRMHTHDNSLFDYVPGESLLWQANEWMVIDFPEASVKDPTQCIALTISSEEIHETLQFLNKRFPRVDESGEWKLNMEEFFLLNSTDLSNVIDKIIRVSVDDNRMKDMFAQLALRELLLKLMQTQASQLIEKVVARTRAIKQGNPLDGEVMIGAQASRDQYEKILSYIEIGKGEGAEVLTGGAAFHQNSGLEHGYYITPTILKGRNNMRVFQEEIFGPVLCVTTFKTTEEAIAIANDTAYGLGAGVWTRDAYESYQVPRAIQAGRVWVNCYHAYPAHAPFGGYKKSGFGRETHKMMLNHYRQTKNMLVSYQKSKLGFF